MANGLAALGAKSLLEHFGDIERQIRSRPQDASLRLAFCHFLAVRGEWARAQDQLNAAVRFDPTFASAASAYATALKGELLRQEFWNAGAPPIVLGDSAAWIDCLLKAAALRADDAGEAAALRASAREEAPALQGRLTRTVAETAPEVFGTEPVAHDVFAWLCDGDVRLGTVFEVFVPSGYGWLPMPAVRSVKLRRPQHLVDLLWSPAEFELRDGQRVTSLMPVRYPADLSSQDDLLAFARRTDWVTLAGEDQFAGLGQRVWTSDEGDYSLLDVRSIEFSDAVPA